ncbi:MAG: family 43 glycosylhydrolase [Colwellia sp.]
MMKFSFFKSILPISSVVFALAAFPVISAQLNVSNFTVDGHAHKIQQHSKKSGGVFVISNVDRNSFVLEAEIRLSSNEANGGILFRSTEEGKKSYLTGFDVKKQQIYIKTPQDIISKKNQYVKENQWYKLRLEVQNNNFVLFVDEKLINADSYPVYDAIDNDFNSGKLGFYAEKGQVDIRNVSFSEYAPKAEQATYTNPVQLNCADPGILKYQAMYYAYCTYTPDFPSMKRGIRLYTSADLVNWQDRGFVMKKEDSWGKSRYWAPDVLEKNGTFYMYYAVDERIGIATSKSPLGPFKQQTKEPMAPDDIKIDAHVFIDDDGKQYFYYVDFVQNADGWGGNQIWGAELQEDMKTINKNSMRELIAPVAPWETHMAKVVEGPVITKHKGYYYMTYSGSHFESPYYSVGYAVAKHPLGPYKKYKLNPIMQSTKFAHGTAHHSVTTSPDGSELFFVYHQHFSLNQTEPRKIAIDRLRFVPQKNGPDILQAWGPTLSPQPVPSHKD